MVLLRKSFISIKKHIKKPYPCGTKFHDFFRNHWTHVDSEITKTKSLVARSRIVNNWCPRCWSCIEYLGPQPPTITTIGGVFLRFSRRLFFYISPWKWWNDACLRHENFKYYSGTSNSMYFQNMFGKLFFWGIQISATFRCLNREIFTIQRNNRLHRAVLSSDPNHSDLEENPHDHIPRTSSQGIPWEWKKPTDPFYLDGPDVGS